MGSKKTAITPNAGFMVQHNTSKARQAARKVGIKIDPPEPHLPLTEQEQADTM